MSTLRIIGDVHAQVDRDILCRRGARPYFEIISDAAYSIQVGDMGDGETYDPLVANVDASRHRFFPGNHDHYDRLPPHHLGNYGSVCWGGVDLFFVRGAASSDREKLVRRGRELGKMLWFENEELTGEQMLAAEQEYLQAKPQIVIKIAYVRPQFIQVIVAHTTKISAEASGRFRMPNWIGVKIRLATRLMANGTATHHGSLRRSACTNTNPKVTRMIGYKIRQIKPMVAGAGVQPGFARLSYHSIQGIADLASLALAAIHLADIRDLPNTLRTLGWFRHLSDSGSLALIDRHQRPGAQPLRSV